MTDRNTQDVIAKLWEDRHTHDEEVALKSDLVFLRETVEVQADAEPSTGARIHLVLADQNIAVSGEKIAWTSEDHRFTRLTFAAPSLPANEIVIPLTDYYGVNLKHFEWDTWDGGGTVQVIVSHNGVETVVEEFTGTSGQKGGALVAPVPCRAGDLISVFIDHGDSSAQDLARAEMNIYKIDREQDTQWEMVFTVTDNFAIVFAEGSWWTSDPDLNADPALFERDLEGTLLNSYSGWDPGLPGDELNHGLAFDGSFLWGVGQSDDPAAHKIDPADGSVDGNIPSNTGGLKGWLGVAFDGTNLFLNDFGNDVLEEYTLAGSFVQQVAHPSGHTLGGITWDGAHFWATTEEGAVIRMDSSFVVEAEIAGPPPGAAYSTGAWTGVYGDIHYRDGFVYVMTRQGLWRKQI